MLKASDDVVCLCVQAGGGVRVLKGLVIQWAHPRLGAPNHAVLHRTNVRRRRFGLNFMYRSTVEIVETG